jgi:phage/plasmid-like protein (TIGR03299 family)
MHEIDGKLAVYARVPAWHQIGTVYEDVFSAEEAMAVLNPLNEKDMYKQVTAGARIWNAATKEYEWIESPDHSAIVRNRPETGEPVILSFQGRDYGNLQPQEVFAFMDDVGEGKYLAAAFLRKGRQMILSKDMGSVMLDAKGRSDVIKRVLFGVNSWDGSWAFRCKFVNDRVECANQAGMALRGSTDQLVPGDWSTRHTGEIMNRVQVARKTLGLFDLYEQLFYERAEAMIEAELTDNVYQKVVESVFKDELTGEIDADAVNNCRGIYELSPTQANLYGTYWGGFNSVSEYNDWRTNVRGGRVSTLNEMRFLRQFEDTKQIKQKAWDTFSAAMAV